MQTRNVEYREGIEGKRPQFSDLSNSSYIEELADTIIMVYRPEYYRIYQDDGGRDLRDKLMILVKKNGLKPSGEFQMRYQEDTGRLFLTDIMLPLHSKFSCMEYFTKDSEPVKKLVKDFDLEEDVPF